MLNQLEDKVKQILKEKADNKDYGIEIYTDYRDRELSDGTIKEIVTSDNPRQYFEDMLYEWATEYSFEYGYAELIKELRNGLTEEENELFEENLEHMEDFVYEYAYYYYDKNDFNNEIDVNIMVDCGNGNYDYTKDNVLNYYGRDWYKSEGDIPNESSILWLAKTQKKATKLREACRRQYRNDGNYVNRNIEEDKFIESCIQEFENLTSHMATLTFLVKMDLFTYFDLIELQKREYDEVGEYDPRKNTKSKSYIVLDKNVECGLFDTWQGGGSVLEIELDNNVKLPIKFAEFCVDGCKQRGWDVNDVYGLVGSAWKNAIIEIKEIK